MRINESKLRGGGGGDGGVTFILRQRAEKRRLTHFRFRASPRYIINADGIIVTDYGEIAVVLFTHDIPSRKRDFFNNCYKLFRNCESNRVALADKTENEKGRFTVLHVSAFRGKGATGNSSQFSN